MAFSSSEGKEFFRDWLNHVAKPLKFQTFLDVGAGAGIYGKLIRETMGQNVTIDAVEIFEPYIERHELRQIYNRIFLEDVMKMDQLYPYDLIIIGDMLEHLEREQAIELVKKLSKKCRFLWVALPIKVEYSAWSTGYKQGAEEYAENCKEKHLYEWGLREFVMVFDPIISAPYIQTGCFLLEGDIR